MDTIEARSRMRDLANQGLEVFDRLSSAEFSSGEAARRYRELVEEARPLLADSGYPGEGVWRGLQRSFALLGGGAAASHDERDELAEELREARDSLDALLSAREQRELDFRIVG